MALVYSGNLAGEEMTGTFKQGPLELPLDLTKGEAAKINRPQEPKEPFPYYIEDVVFQNSSAP